MTLFYRKRWVRITCRLVIKDQGSGAPLFGRWNLYLMRL